MRELKPEELEELKWIAMLQFGSEGAGMISEGLVGEFSKTTMKLRRVFRGSDPYLALRASDFRLILYAPAGIVLNKLLPHPRARVYVSSGVAKFVAEGGNVFCKHVVMADPEIRPGDEVLAVDESGRLLGVGRAVKPGWEMVLYKWGEAVKIRQGVEK